MKNGGSFHSSVKLPEGNPRFRVWLCSSYVHLSCPELLEAAPAQLRVEGPRPENPAALGGRDWESSRPLLG